MAKSSAIEAIQTAVAAVLVGDATLITLVGGVDRIRGFEPEEPPAKFIVVGNATEQTWNTLGGSDAGFGWDDTLTIHIYSYQKGDTEVLAMLSRVTALLNFATLVVSGYNTVICEYGDKITKVLVETKDKQERRHIPAIFSFKVHE
jgi:hypothetical protein